MEFFLRASGAPRVLGILPGSFHPPTRAHLALAQAALQSKVDEVVFVLPRVFPHKRYEQVGVEDRVRMLKAALADRERVSIASTEKGLFIDIARECLEAYGPGTRLMFICGRDAAERIVNWDYGTPGAIHEMLDVFELLVASRGAEYQPPPELASKVHPLALPGGFDSVSATRIRERIGKGLPWEHLAPEGATELIRELYGARGA
ncbi:MAG: hypothetical protein WD696_21865 [Bryobacteraceae bacterium]